MKVPSERRSWSAEMFLQEDEEDERVPEGSHLPLMEGKTRGEENR